MWDVYREHSEKSGRWKQCSKAGAGLIWLEQSPKWGEGEDTVRGSYGLDRVPPSHNSDVRIPQCVRMGPYLEVRLSQMSVARMRPSGGALIQRD